MSRTGHEAAGAWPPDRDALYRAGIALTDDERVDWLDAMLSLAAELGATAKPVPDQLRTSPPPAPPAAPGAPGGPPAP